MATPLEESAEPRLGRYGLAVALGEITRPAVLAALREHDELGEDAFLSRYGFDKARAFYLRHDGKRYASKAIAGAAHGHLDGRQPLAANEFSGGELTVARKLRELGFIVPPRRSPAWTRDEVILACDIVADNGWRQLEDTDPRVIELSGMLQFLPIHPHDLRSDTFRNPNGVARKTADIASQHPDYRGRPTNGGETDRTVLKDFLEQPDHMHSIAEFLRQAAREGTLQQLDASYEDPLEDDVPETEMTAREGRIIVSWHFTRERSKKLRKQKIAEFEKVNGRIFCEICSFDFEEVYGPRGHLFTECHHTVPLHESGDTVTKVEDLILLCANCHRMIHRGTPWLTPDQLRAAIAANDRGKSAGMDR